MRDQNTDSLNIDSPQVSSRNSQSISGSRQHDCCTLFQPGFDYDSHAPIIWICMCHTGVSGVGAAREFYETRRISPCEGLITTIAMM